MNFFVNKEAIIEIENKIWNSIQNDERIGLLNGLSGVALFYNLLNKKDKNRYEAKLLFVVEKINNLIYQEENLMTFCSGISGYAYMLLQIKNEVISIDNEYFNALDEILQESLQESLIVDDYDFLHGSLGIVMYFMKRYELKKELHIKEILLSFLEIFIRKIHINLEEVLVNRYANERSIHFGLAHGLSGTLNFLIRFKKCLGSDYSVIIDDCLITITNYLKNHKSYREESKQCYPSSYSIDNKMRNEARLGWCQGDLGIGNAIYNVGLSLNNTTIKEEGLFLMKETVKIDFKESFVDDYAICHGSSGILLQYYFASVKTNEDFSEGIEYWFAKLKEQTKDFTDFKTVLVDQYVDDYNILYGITGLVLVLLTINNEIDADNWIECLNLY
ncbi:lanthionine synthetase LanC family protein [Flavobacterium sp.]|uniref:lanthionine synthetase LanC family protein n=2 Tax=Flavobacterium sp. TaxID=239 RepID=UPI0040470CB8